MTRIRFEDVEVDFPGAPARLGPTSFELSPGTVLVLCGETGSGKSLVLELMAGLRRPSSGTVTHDDREASKIRAERRGVGMAFQNGQLYEHLDVRRNLDASCSCLTHDPPRRSLLGQLDLGERNRHRLLDLA